MVSKDFIEFQKEFSKLFDVYNAKRISKVDIDKKEIKVAFLSPDFFKDHSITYFIKNLIKDLKKQNLKLTEYLFLKIKNTMIQPKNLKYYLIIGLL